MKNYSHNASIYLITYNEEKDITACLESVSWSNDIVVLDSYSTDSTAKIASSFDNVRVFKRKFLNYSEQRNYGLKNINFINPWVFIIDADEVCTDKLKEEILKIASIDQNSKVAYSERRNIFFNGKFLKYNSFYNVYVERLVKPEYVYFYGDIHEKLICDGETGELTNILNHFPFSKGIDNWIARRNNYSTISAALEQKKAYTLSFKDIFSTNPIKRRAFLNGIYRRLPLRWVIFFLYNFLFKFCFLDGTRGIKMVLLETFYEFLIVCKIDYKKDEI